MIQNLLDVGRIRSGQGLSADMSECDPTGIAHEIVDEMTTVYGDHFVLKADPEIHTWWRCDLIRRSLENLVSNAVKYGASEAPITVSLQQAESSVKITVHNEGNPIPKNEQANLFKKYRRSKSAEKSSAKGWGLGLTLVSGVAQAHSGTIEVESSEAKGTSFTMILPKDCRETRAQRAQGQPVEPLRGRAPESPAIPSSERM